MSNNSEMHRCAASMFSSLGSAADLRQRSDALSAKSSSLLISEDELIEIHQALVVGLNALETLRIECGILDESHTMTVRGASEAVIRMLNSLPNDSDQPRPNRGQAVSFE